LFAAGGHLEGVIVEPILSLAQQMVGRVVVRQLKVGGLAALELLQRRGEAGSRLVFAG